MVAWLATSLPSAAARTNPGDAQATGAYLQASDEFFSLVIANSHRGSLAADELAERVAGECPGVASGARITSEAALRIETKVRSETALAVVLALITPDLPAYQHLAITLETLSWRSHKLTALVRRAERTAAAVAKLRPPNLCGDLKEWAASGFTKLPAGTSRFLAESRAAENGGESTQRIAKLLRPYEGRRGRALQYQTERLSARISRTLESGLTHFLDKLRAPLGLSERLEMTSILTVQPPPEVAQEGGKRLEEFDLGRAVAAQSGCLACHRIGEAGNHGPGPDLTHIASRLPGAAIARTLINPTAPMPSFRNLPKEKFEALVEFLSLLH